MNAIPGGAAARGNLASVDWKVCTPIGGKLKVRDEFTLGMSTGPEAVVSKFNELMATHLNLESKLDFLFPTNAPPAGAASAAAASVAEANDVDPATTDLKSFADEAAAGAASGGIVKKIPLPIAGVTLLVGNDGQMYMMASEKMTIPANTHIGGIGGGGLQAKDATKNEGVVSYGFSSGAPPSDLQSSSR